MKLLLMFEEYNIRMILVSFGFEQKFYIFIVIIVQ